MANPELQNMVKDALNALYHHPDDSIRMQADRWLQDFQRTIDAWQVCDSLLHDVNSNMETLIFCSQTLRSKVQRDFEELPFEAFGPLRDSLYALLRKLYNGPSKVRTQISIAMASLAVHVSAEDWGHGGIVYWLKDEINAHPECLRSFLELLTVLPQEVFSYKIAARPQRRREFEQELISSMETALSLLTACSGLGDLREQVLDSFGSWLRLNHCIPAATLASHPLVLTTLFSLTSDQLLEAAVNVVSELIHYTASGRTGGLSVQMPLIQVLVPHVMGLKEQLRDPSKDEEDVKAIARLFADMGDSYVDLISTGSQESMLIVQSLLELASHREYDISSMTYNFWHNLQLNLTGRDMYHSYGSESSIELERKRRLQAFHSTYESLVSMVYFRIQYPENYLELSKEDIKEIKQTRQAVQDVLMDSACVLGSEQTLKILFTKLLQTIGSHTNDGTYQWRPVEAGLYCIWSIANSVPIEEAEIMPQVMALLEKLPRQHILLQTACATIGAYSKWIDGASAGLSVLPVIMEMLISGMSLFENSAVAAALAFRNVCIDCGKKLCSSLDSLFLIYNRAINAEGDCKVSDEGVLHIIEGLSMIVSELPANHAKKALELLCLPVVTPLQEIINQGAESMRQVVARHITIHIDRLAKIFRYVNHPEAVADATQKLWPTFKAFFEYRAWDMRTMEALCSACKYSVRTSGKFMENIIGQMLDEVQNQYRLHHQPCFLYLSSEVIKIFGSDSSCASYLGNLIEVLFRHTTGLLVTIQDFTTRPDIADDCFLLASRCIRYCPNLFVPSSVFPSLVDCSIVGIPIQHREACLSILTFLSDILDLANSHDGQRYRHIIDHVLLPRGLSLSRILIASLTGALPSSRLEEVSYVLLALSKIYGGQALEWSRENVSLIPSTAASEGEISRFLRGLADAASGSGMSTLSVAVEELSDVCRRNRTVQEIVQKALKVS